MNVKQPFSVDDRVDHPISLYAATKKSNELMAHTYSHLFNIPTTGLRFFTVYGPYGRPDMAYFKFTQSIINGEAIDVYAENRMERDFTYIDDIISGILPFLNSEYSEQARYGDADKKLYRVFNIGGGRPISLSGFIRAIEKSCGKKALKNHLPMQPGDVISTFADISNLAELSDYTPAVSVEEGVQRFYDWYQNYSEISNDWAE
jgi:UDP-glucuronate 4-epimerase